MKKKKVQQCVYVHNLHTYMHLNLKYVIWFMLNKQTNSLHILICSFIYFVSTKEEAQGYLEI